MQLKAQVSAVGTFDGCENQLYLVIEGEEFAFELGCEEEAREWAPKLYDTVTFVPLDEGVGITTCTLCGERCFDYQGLGDQRLCIVCVGRQHAEAVAEVGRLRKEVIGLQGDVRAAENAYERGEEALQAWKERANKAEAQLEQLEAAVRERDDARKRADAAEADVGRLRAELDDVRKRPAEAPQGTGGRDAALSAAVGPRLYGALASFARECNMGVAEAFAQAVRDYLPDPPDEEGDEQLEGAELAQHFILKFRTAVAAGAKLGVSSSAMGNWARGHKRVPEARQRQMRELLAGKAVAA